MAFWDSLKKLMYLCFRMSGKKGLTALKMLLAKPILLFEHYRNNFITSG